MRNNPTWTIDPEYWWNPFEWIDQPEGMYRIENSSKTGPFVSSEKFKPELPGKLFGVEDTKEIGFNR